MDVYILINFGFMLCNLIILALTLRVYVATKNEKVQNKQWRRKGSNPQPPRRR